MDETSLISAISMGFGVLLAVAAGVTYLLYRTQGVTPARRLRLMVHLAYSAVIHALYRRSVAAVVAGFFAFVGTLCVGLAITLLVIWATSPEYSHQTEAYETFGDLVSAMIKFAFGIVVSSLIAEVVGLRVGEHVAAGGSSHQAKPGSSTSRAIESRPDWTGG